jgi:hypothetical protein
VSTLRIAEITAGYATIASDAAWRNAGVDSKAVIGGRCPPYESPKFDNVIGLRFRQLRLTKMSARIRWRTLRPAPASLDHPIMLVHNVLNRGALRWL